MKVSIITPIYNTPSQFLEKAFQSVLAQSYTDWEWCICDDCSTNADTIAMINNIKNHPQVNYIRSATNGGIGQATINAATLATGELYAFIDSDDELVKDAIKISVGVFLESDIDMTYSDEDIIDINNNRMGTPHYKPDYSPHYLMCNNYMCHFVMIKASLYKRVGGVRSGYDGAQDHEFLLRVSENTDKIHHIPRVLYHWRHFDTYTRTATTQIKTSDVAKKAVSEALSRRGYPKSDVYTVLDGKTSNERFLYYHTKYFAPQPKVSIIISFKDSEVKLISCLNSIQSLTSYINYDITLLCKDTAIVDGIFSKFPQLKTQNIKVLKPDLPEFNYSKLLNYGVNHVTGDYIVVLHDGITITTKDWIEQLVTYAVEPSVGVVSGKILDNHTSSIIYAGAYLSMNTIVSSYFNNMPDNSDFWNRGTAVQEVSAAFSSSMMFSKNTYKELKGFNEDYTIYHADIDFCLRAQEKNKQIIYNPNCVFKYKRTGTRKSNFSMKDYVMHCEADDSRFRITHQDVLNKVDKYLNPNLANSNNPICSITTSTNFSNLPKNSNIKITNVTQKVDLHNPLVSFIIPWYKDVPTVIPALLAQTYKDIELIVVYDGPIPTESTNLITAFNDTRIHLYNTDKAANNWGHTPRNYGLSKVSFNSDFVVFTGMDNYYMPTYTQELLMNFNIKVNSAVYSDFYYNGRNWDRVNCALKCGQIDCGCVMVQTEIAKKLQWKHVHYEADWAFIADIIREHGAHSIKRVPRSLYIHN